MFCHKYPGMQVSASSVIFKLVQKVCSAGLFLDKKYLIQHTEYCVNQGKVWWSLSHLKTLISQIPDTISSIGTGFDADSVKSDKKLCLRLYKIRFKQLKETIIRENAFL